MQRRIKQIRNSEETKFYKNLKISKKQFENCLLPLWIFGEGTDHEIAQTLKLPITEISQIFVDMAKLNFINIHPIRSTKLNQQNNSLATNYVLSSSGKHIVQELFSFNKNLNNSFPEPKNNKVAKSSFGSIINKALEN